jgi:hypothetical protein
VAAHRLIHRSRVAPFGATLEIAADDPRFCSAAAFALGRYPRGPTIGLTVELVARTLSPTGPGSWPATTLTERPDGIELRSGRSCLVAARRDPTRVVAHLDVEPAILADPDATRVFVEAAMWWAMINGGHVYAVHAGMVARGRSGVVLRGPSGAGKSTLTYACLRRAMAVVSDDWIYAPAGAAEPVLHGYPWLMWLTTDAAARFPELATIEPVPHPGSDRIKVPVVPPVQRRRITMPVAAVVFLEPSPTVTVTAIDRAEAHDRFSVSALDSERGSLPASFVDRLLGRPCFVLGRGPSPDDAARELDHLVRRSAASRE